MKKVTSEQFLNAFHQEWLNQVEHNWDQLDRDWAAPRARVGQKTPWTLFMLGEGGFLDLLRQRLKDFITPLKYYPEMYAIDAAIVGGDDLFRVNLGYPSMLHVLIEHEAGDYVEEEMWKLIFWRSPLKVLIFYDYDDHRKSHSNSDWLERKITELRSMIRKAEAERGYKDNSDYLFIIGCRKSMDGEIYWRWTSDREEETKLLK